MNGMKGSRTAGLVLAMLVVGCTRSSKPLVVPRAEDVSHVFVSKHVSSFTVWTYEITDPERIAAIVDHLGEHNPDEYRIETDLYAYWVNKPLPRYDYSFALMTDTSMALAVTVGPDWLGGAHGRGGVLQRETDQRLPPPAARRPGARGAGPPP